MFSGSNDTHVIYHIVPDLLIEHYGGRIINSRNMCSHIYKYVHILDRGDSCDENSMDKQMSQLIFAAF